MKLVSLNNEKGFTIIESMIALVIFAFGILAVASMQTGTIRANSNASARSEANALALTFMEVLQQLPYDASVLTDTDNNGDTGLDDTLSNADYGVFASDFQANGVFENLGNMYTVINDTSHTLIDARGREYQIFWNISDRNLGSSGEAKLIRMFVTWDTQMGKNSSIMTSVKYKNIAL